MDIIQLLPDSVANQIAAGEVIQRPASVVKELVENAVDAGARRIDVAVVDAGRTSVQVADDGCGMTETDARLAFERHATSKIRQAADLFTLTTMGFRGEALPSIAAVAQVELCTRTAGHDLGTRIIIEGSRVLSQEPEACHAGSVFTVKNLFYNVPARRKFLKSNQTELSNITTEMERIVLVHPDIAFTLTSNGMPLLTLAPASLKQRIGAVCGQRMAERLLNVDVETSMVSIHGFVGTPEQARRRGAQQFFFVNGRYMRHPYFHRAVQEAFQQLVPAETQVPYFVYFTVPPAELDVNIHPTKTEIKFENEQAVWQILLAALREALGRFNAIPTIDFDTVGRPDNMPVYRAGATDVPAPPQVSLDPAFNPFTAQDTVAQATAHHAAATAPHRWESLYEGMQGDAAAGSRERAVTVPSLALDPAPLLAGASMQRSAELLQYRGEYVLAAVPDGLLLVHQHRAHVRILYDRYLALLATAAPVTQRLLFPAVLTFGAAEAATIATLLEPLRAMGMDISQTAPTVFAVAGMPAGMEGVDPQRLLADLAATAAADTPTPAAMHHSIAMAMARAAAIPTGQVLAPLEMSDLMDQLFASADPNHTPTGAAITALIPQSAIDRMFS